MLQSPAHCPQIERALRHRLEVVAHATSSSSDNSHKRHKRSRRQLRQQEQLLTNENVAPVAMVEDDTAPVRRRVAVAMPTQLGVQLCRSRRTMCATNRNTGAAQQQAQQQHQHRHLQQLARRQQAPIRPQLAKRRPLQRRT